MFRISFAERRLAALRRTAEFPRTLTAHLNNDFYFIIHVSFVYYKERSLRWWKDTFHSRYTRYIKIDERYFDSFCRFIDLLRYLRNEGRAEISASYICSRFHIVFMIDVYALRADDFLLRCLDNSWCNILNMPQCGLACDLQLTVYKGALSRAARALYWFTI